MSTKEDKEDGGPTSGRSTRSTRSSRRRRNENNKDGAMIAPGFGTRKDLMQLSEDLSRGNDAKLPVEAVEAMMQSRGRGIVASTSSLNARKQKEKEEAEANGTPVAKKTRGGTEGDTTATKSTPVSSAWADFMKDEGFDNVLPTTGTRSSRNSSKDNTDAAAKKNENAGSANDPASIITPDNDKKNSNGDDDNSDEKKRPNYDLESLRPNKKSKTTTDSNPSNNKNNNKKKKGVLLQTGSLDCTMIGRGSVKKGDWDVFKYHLQVPTKILPDIYVTNVYTSSHAVHNIATDIAGNVYGWGRNDQKQLTASMPKNVPVPTLLEDIINMGPIRSAALGKSHTVFLLQEEDSLVACGLNKSGQCGINRQSMETVPNLKPCVFAKESINKPSDNNNNKKNKGTSPSASSLLPTIIQIACGEDFSLALDSDGFMYSTGSSEFGQLGDGETGEYFVSASKLAFRNCHMFTKRTTYVYEPNVNLHQSTKHRDKTKVIPIPYDIRIQAIACGKHHALALEAPATKADATGKGHVPRLFSWGCGDYGCLGHGVQADEYYPRVIATLQQQLIMYSQHHQQTTTTNNGTNDDNILISAGAHCSLLCSKRNGYVYYWGKHKSAGEAVMKPALIDQLANNQHMVTHIGAGGQTVVCSTLHKQTIAWGQGPYGELGIGSKKSSSKPAFVDTLDGIRVSDVACGYGTTLFVVQEENDDNGGDEGGDDSATNNNKLVDDLTQIDIDQVSEQLGNYFKTLSDAKASEPPAKKGRKKSTS